MASEIKIKDSGLYYVGATLISGEARAYGDTGIGTDLTLKTAELSFGFEVMNSSDSPVSKKHNNSDTSYFEFGKADSNGVQNPTWTLRGYINRTNETDMITFGRLKFMCQTKGIKQISSCNDVNYKDLIAYSQYGEREFNGETTKTISSINVTIKSMSVVQSADKQGFHYTINLVETL
jgi:hypothetical protein